MDTRSGSRIDLPSINFLPEPVEKFRESLGDCLKPDEPGMKKGALFTDVLSEADAAKMPTGVPTRSEVFALAADDSVHVASVCGAAMACGGMNVGHWNRLWDSNDGEYEAEWLKVAQRIRDGDLNRADAYACLHALRTDKKQKGMGPAYFTKLIYFLTPRDGAVGRILDQPADRFEQGPAGWHEEVEALGGRARRVLRLHRIGREHQ